ncbi:MAG TPA: glycosyltransferase family 39 protein [Vicinamibacterales bacterium]|nr:glycosyltransferase family 39 protein [Vicinamibacterales bacterium]
MLIAVLAAIYFYDLGNTPVYFGGDEAHFGVAAHSIANTGRNLRGDFLPLFVNLSDPLGRKPHEWGDTYYQPVLFYLTALVVKVLPLSITSVRLTAAFIGGILTPLLMYLVALRVIGRRGPALAAALLLALAPTQVVLSRQALDYICPLPFVCGWLWCLHEHVRTGQRKFAIAAGAILGVGCYSYIASWAMMPGYLLLSWIVMWRQGRCVRPIAESGLAFAVPVSLALLWIALHPDMLAQTMARYDRQEGQTFGLLPTYLSFFDPTLLFIRGGPSMTTSTARSGFVLLSAAPLLAAGALALWRRRDWVAFVIVAGIVSAPIPAALKGEPSLIQRAMYLLPFLALTGGLGFALLWQSRSWAVRLVTVAALALAPVQFAYFYFDYFTHYKLRSAFYYDNVAFVDVAAYLIADRRAPAFYFADDVDDASVKWRFYSTVNGKAELLARTQYIAPDAVPAGPADSLLVTYEQSPRLERLTAGGWRIEKIVHDVDNRPAAAILRKQR